MLKRVATAPGCAGSSGACGENGFALLNLICCKLTPLLQAACKRRCEAPCGGITKLSIVKLLCA